MKTKRQRYRSETFKFLVLVVGLFGIGFWLRERGFTKQEGIILVTVCSFISFCLGRISVPEGGVPPAHADDADL